MSASPNWAQPRKEKGQDTAVWSFRVLTSLPALGSSSKLHETVSMHFDAMGLHVICGRLGRTIG